MIAPDTFMRRAAALALEKMRANLGGPFGALIVQGGEIVAEGWNEVTSSNDPTAHAEVRAIRRACARLGTFQLTGCDLYTNCEPCPMCLGAIYWARLRHIYYVHTRAQAAAIGFDDDFIYGEIARDPAARSIPATRLALPDGPDAFAEWASKPDKVRY
jgi:guanine deaminase